MKTLIIEVENKTNKEQLVELFGYSFSFDDTYSKNLIINNLQLPNDIIRCLYDNEKFSAGIANIDLSKYSAFNPFVIDKMKIQSEKNKIDFEYINSLKIKSVCANLYGDILCSQFVSCNPHDLIENGIFSTVRASYNIKNDTALFFTIHPSDKIILTLETTLIKN